MRIDDDAVIWSASPADRAGRPLLIVLHGYDFDEHQLFARVAALSTEPVVAALRAPHDAGNGYAWYPVGVTRTWDQMAVDAEATATAIVEWLDRAAPDAPSVAVAGFSQGGATAIETLRLAPDRFSFAVILSGTVMPQARGGDARLADLRPPVFWARGDADRVLAAIRIRSTAAFLAEHADADVRVYGGLDHSLADDELRELGGWLAERYADARVARTAC